MEADSATARDGVPSATPTRLFKCLADETRLQLTLLIRREGELCVCEMTHALGESQPKISRHLAQLRECGLLQDRRDGQWVYYRLAERLADWMTAVLAAAEAGEASRLDALQARLQHMGNRPERRAALC
ncbi:metalloregulator ArsR/SmtB family transcription factor [Halomonas sp. MCCC 1A17488]|uniref:Metalloregulator ArsR/SmtB family transcription factor n=1 Tax=Billgrantia sulfidoxydans TaxID=2733484 RepID=A0ABX7W6C4_9GAMM|nr:metalloregulator ArsR/SmtB family transcription factor [Halomonas sp. MCCC 1A17488]MCG3239038.1 metalloregulator ArsR/SmtB family transcription factor [Halomonas sp. MCCC 1A17488]QPP51012.1 metalloregulator ArsR/SmtB family transcription factor [Halomonas sp. SS10-MC5]QTP54524.1 metalloregulator ArsR/SmtB family transcription factor [Halomonas sulfidoxydans]